MSVFRVRVGLPLEKARVVSRGGWRKWSARSPIRREQHNKARTPRSTDPSGLETAKPETSPSAEVLEARSLSLLPIRHFLILSLMMFLVILVGWGLVRSNHLSVALSYEISGLIREKLELQEINRQLKMELAKIGSLDQLEKVAMKNLGLITPNQGQIVVIEP